MLAPLAAGGFRETADFALAFSAELLGDLGFERLEIAPALGAVELQRTLNAVSPITLALHSLLFAALGPDPVWHVLLMIFLHLLVLAVAMEVARRWRPASHAAVGAGLVIGLHPLAAGVTGGVTALGPILALLCVLGAVAFSLSLINEDHHRPLLPVVLFAVLAVAFDPSGILVLPAVALFAMAAPRNSDQRGVLRRLEPPLAAAIGVSASIYAMKALPQSLASWQLLTMWRLNQLPDQIAWMLRALFLPASGAEGCGPDWLVPLVIAVPASLVTAWTFVRLRRRPSLLIWPALVAASLIPASLAIEPLRTDAPTTAFVAFYPTLVFFGLWIADLWPKPSRQTSRWIVGALIVVCLVPQTTLLAWRLAERATRVNQMGQELAALIAQTPNGSDVLLPVVGDTAPLIESAFVAAFYRGVQPRQARFRLVIGGRVALRERVAPSGQELGVFTRLPLREQKRFIGLDAGRRHLVDLTSLVRGKIRIAQDILDAERRSPTPLALTDEGAISGWLDGPVQWQESDPDGAAWFVEGMMLRLHPHTGRLPK